ncbi:MAG: hypothetical protein ACXWX5_08605, partial [Actinomycetota bacterium]
RMLNVTEKLTVFLVEQNAFHALKLAHRGYVLVNGEITLAGTGRELLVRPRHPMLPCSSPGLEDRGIGRGGRRRGWRRSRAGARSCPRR